MEQSQETAIELTLDGYGVVLKNNRHYKIPNLLPGEEAIIQTFHNGTGKVVELVKSSPERMKSACPWFDDCGGCQMHHLAYAHQLALKTARIRDVLNKVGIDPVLCLDIIGMKEPLHYRNKCQMAISERNRKVMAGFYEEYTHKLVNVDHCLIQDDRANIIIKTCRKLFQDHKIPIYDEDKRTGLIRHILIRLAKATDEILVVIVTASEVFPGRNNFLKALIAAHPEITSVVQNINPRATSIVLGDLDRVLYGKGTIEDSLLKKRFLIGSKTFYQINHRQTEILYTKALEFAKPSKEDLVLDLYSGIGTIGLCFSDHVNEVIAVEENKTSVKNAIQNARLNQKRNIRFLATGVEEYLSAIVDIDRTPNIVIVDPPRSGLTEAVIQQINRMKPQKLIYISCDPESLGSNLQSLIKSNYQVKKVQPVDMFPYTSHVETITLLSLKTA
ncbi:MAG: 23S rRNA (uracil(1939)-C(5))-methyltransferase RlmD [Acholeplasmataceae bacterium]|nr:23S rRNA (uracil(1939)-C(5))-methyltransferase RlmD [Acholeplasmataceae bacterium]